MRIFPDKKRNKKNKRCSFNKVFWKYVADLLENTHVEVWFQQKWNHTSAWVFSCKFAAYFQNTLLKEHLGRAASGINNRERNPEVFKPKSWLFDAQKCVAIML